ncbi:MAG: cytidine deaminase [Lachnospiraceae bacterium]|nr:cytidine deaminase [Lachnospiraceae bacterium]
MENKELVELAIKARKMSYSPYSGFCVGAALETASGEVFTGCNIENAAYGPSNCAERTAFFKAVSEGVREFKRIAIVGAPKDEDITSFCPPCGVCRQVMSEFCDKDSFSVVLYNGKEIRTYTLGELLPLAFELD